MFDLVENLETRTWDADKFLAGTWMETSYRNKRNIFLLFLRHKSSCSVLSVALSFQGRATDLSATLVITLYTPSKNPICRLLALLEARHIFHVLKIRVKFIY